jgi:hypothetical protein
MTLDTEVSAEFKEFVKGKNFSQEDAQKLIDMQTKLANKSMDAWGVTLNEWKESASADKEYGGAEFQANVAVAKHAIAQFGTPELTNLLNTSGMGNNPEVIRFFYRVGKAIGPDKIMGGAASSNVPKKSGAELLYPTMTQTT